MLVKFNKYGEFLGCSGYPECQNTRSLAGEGATEEFLGNDPVTGKQIRAKVGPYGPYVERETEEGEKPKRASLPSGTDIASVDLETALKYLSLPREIGTDPASGEKVFAGEGRYGPYVRQGKTFASLRNPQEMFTVGLEEAVALIEQKKKGGGKRVIKALGVHEPSGNSIDVLEGRYGPYVSDGNVNATLPKGMDPDEVDMETAVDLLARKAAKGGGRKRGGRGTSGRGKAAGGKTSAKKTSRKTSPGKKAPGKKAPRKKPSP